MDTQEDLSNKLIIKSDNILKKRKHEKEQLEVKRDNPKPTHKSTKSNKLPVDFAGILVKCENEGYLTISISNSSYKIYKKLVKLQWLKVVSLHNSKLKFKLTDLGWEIFKDIKPTGFSDETLASRGLAIVMASCELFGIIVLVSAVVTRIFQKFQMFTIPSNTPISLYFTATISMIIGVFVFGTFLLNVHFTNKHRVYLTTDNCIKVASKYLDNHQLKCEEQLLNKYAKEE